MVWTRWFESRTNVSLLWCTLWHGVSRALWRSGRILKQKTIMTSSQTLRNCNLRTTANIPHRPRRRKTRNGIQFVASFRRKIPGDPTIRHDLQEEKRQQDFSEFLILFIRNDEPVDSCADLSDYRRTSLFARIYQANWRQEIRSLFILRQTKPRVHSWSFVSLLKQSSKDIKKVNQNVGNCQQTKLIPIHGPRWLRGMLRRQFYSS